MSAVPFHAVHLVRVLVKLLPDWLPASKLIFNALCQRWKLPARMERMKSEPGLPLVQLLESKRLAACILSYVAAHPEETQPLLDVFTLYTVKSSVDMNFVGKFVTDVVCGKYTVAQQQQLLLQWVVGFRSDEGELAVVHLTQLVLPLLQHAFDSGETELLSDELMDKLVGDVLGGPDDRYGETGGNTGREKCFHIFTCLAVHHVSAKKEPSPGELANVTLYDVWEFYVYLVLSPSFSLRETW